MHNLVHAMKLDIDRPNPSCLDPPPRLTDPCSPCTKNSLEKGQSTVDICCTVHKNRQSMGFAVFVL